MAFVKGGRKNPLSLKSHDRAKVSFDRSSLRFAKESKIQGGSLDHRRSNLFFDLLGLGLISSCLALLSFLKSAIKASRSSLDLSLRFSCRSLRAVCSSFCFSLRTFDLGLDFGCQFGSLRFLGRASLSSWGISLWAFLIPRAFLFVILEGTDGLAFLGKLLPF